MPTQFVIVFPNMTSLSPQSADRFPFHVSVAGARRLGGEASDPTAGIAQLLPGVLVAVETRGGEQGEELRLGDVQVTVGHEHHRLLRYMRVPGGDC